jgi:hypothetical protein
MTTRKGETTMSTTRIKTIALLTIPAALQLLSGCGGERQTLCITQDVTNPAQTEAYTSRMQDAVRRAADAQQDVKVVPFAGSPKTESQVVTGSFADVKDSRVRIEVRTLLNRVDERVLDMQDTFNRDKRSPGSGVVDAIAKATEGAGCSAGVLALTDALELRQFDVYHDDIVSASGRSQIVDRIKDAGALPSLEGVKVTMPFGGIVPDGSEISKDPQRVNALPDIYREIVEAGGGNLEWGS